MSTVAHITGLGVATGFGFGVAAFSAGLRAGRTAIVEQDGPGPRFRATLPAFDLAVALEDLPSLPAELRKRALGAARRTPRSVHVSLAVAMEAWLAADCHERPVPPDRVGIVATARDLDGHWAHETHMAHAVRPDRAPPTFALHALSTNPIGVISQTFGVAGPGFTVGLASASGNAAVISAARLIAAGEVDRCLVLGIPVVPSSVELGALANLGALSWDAPSVPFDASHRGFVIGEGAACLILEAPGAAQAGSLADLAGYAHVLDANALPAPAVAGEVAAMRRALRRAGRGPAEIDYVNAHGTGSIAGDHAELDALRHVFAQPGPWITSTKSLVGHCLGAAGVIEAAATVLAIRYGFVHAMAGLVTPSAPTCRLPGPDGEKATIRAALSNGLAFGGVNTSLVLTAPQ